MSESNKKLVESEGSKQNQPQSTNIASSIQVRMNLFPLDVHQCQMFEYNISISPEIVNESDRKEVIDTFVAEHKLSPYLLKKGRIILQKSIPIIRGSLTYKKVSYDITLQIVQNQRKDQTKSDVQKQNELLNSILEKKGLIQIGRNFYEPNSKTQITDKNNNSGSIATINGITTSILSEGTDSSNLPAEKSNNLSPKTTLLEMDLTSKVIHTESLFTELNKDGFLTDELSKLDSKTRVRQQEIEQSLIGRSVITQYNGRIYQISGIVWDMTTDSTFLWDKQGKNSPQYVSYSKFYEEKYGIYLKNKKQPFVVSIIRGNINPMKVYLPLEVLNLINLSDAERENYDLMNQINRNIQIKPNDRVNKLKAFINNLNLQSDLKLWNITLTPDIITVPGQFLPFLEIKIGDPKSIQLDAKDNFQNSLGHSKILQPIPFNNWIIIFEKNKVYREEIENLIKDIQRLGSIMGIKIRVPKVYGVESIEKFLHNYSGEESGNLVQMILTISRGKSKPLYRAIKQQCWIRLGIPSQHLNIKSLFKHRDSVIINCIRQMNVKMNGSLWTVKNSHIPLESLVIGVDVWHGGSGQKESSIASIVSSDDQGMHYKSELVFLKRVGQEIIQEMSNIIQKRFREYNEAHGQNPKYLIIFRDGVGESQFAEVLIKEIKTVNLKLPKILVVCANKRTHRKLFVMDNKNQFTNPLPGTTVPGIRSEDKFENFYEVSHITRQGTVNPTHYTIIYNTTELNVEEIQEIVYEFTHMYYNWPGGIRVPAPIEYAHKQAYQHGQAKIGDINRRLGDTIYYI